MSGSIIWKNIIGYIILIFIVALAIMYFTNLLHFKDTISAVLGNMHLPNVNLSSITDFVSKNTTLIGIAAPLGITALTYYIKNYQTNKLLDASIEKANQAQLDASSAAKSKIDALQKQIDELNNDTTADTLQQKLSSIVDQNSKLTSSYEEAQKTISRLQTQLDARPVIKIPEIR